MSSSNGAAPVAPAFSHADAEIITHQVSLDTALVSSTASESGSSIEALYEIEATVAQLMGVDSLRTPTKRTHSRNFRHVALQFPDELLIDSVPIYWSLKKAIRTARESIKIAGLISAQEETTEEPELYVLADTSYGNCCVDEVAAAHISADVVVHYGHACLSLTARLPTIYVFSKLPFEFSEAVTSITDKLDADWQEQHAGTKSPVEAGAQLSNSQAISRNVALMYEVGYAWKARELKSRLEEEWRRRRTDVNTGSLGSVSVYPQELDTRAEFTDKLEGGAEQVSDEQFAKEALARSNGSCCGGSKGGDEHGNAGCQSGGCKQSTSSAMASTARAARQIAFPSGVHLADCDIVYIGGESLALTNLLLANPPAAREPKRFLRYDPRSSGNGSGAHFEDGRSTNRLLMRRYALVQKAKDAAVIGLLVGTLGVRSYLPLLQSLRRLLTGPGSRRKVYTISVGKLNPAKLANFQEIDLFVLVACPENSLALHGSGGGQHAGKDYLRPVITPFEMLVALRSLREGDGSGAGWGDGYELDLARLNLTSEGERCKRTGDEDAESVGEAGAGGEQEQEDSDRSPHFSLVTGGFVSRQSYLPSDDLRRIGNGTRQQGQIDVTASKSVVLRSQDGTLTRVLDSASPAHLENRSWKGLERRIGMDQPAVLEEGRAGIARGYAEADGTKEGNS